MTGTPQFASGAVLSARQLAALDDLEHDLYNRAASIRIPQPVWVVSTDRVKYASVVHRHESAYSANEYLYYDIEVAAGGNCQIYYKDTNTPLVNLTASGRQRNLVSLQNWPTAGSHPANNDPVDVVVKTTVGNGATVYDLKEIWTMPAGSWVSLNSATALTDNQGMAVPADLQQVSNNLAVLDHLAQTSIPMFRQAGNGTLGRVNDEEIAIETWAWHTSRAGKFYYRVRLHKFANNTGNTPAWYTTVRFRIDTVLVATLTYNGTDPTGSWTNGKLIEGCVDLNTSSNAGIRDRLINQTMLVTATVAFGRNKLNDGADGGYGAAEIHFLGEGV